VIIITQDKLSIRKLSIEDRPVVVRILNETPSFSQEDAMLALELIDVYFNVPDQKDYEMYCGVIDDKVVGYMCFGRTPLTLGTYDLYWIVVDHNMKGKNIGTSLLKKAEEIIKERDARIMLIETSSRDDYHGTRRFYEKNGYLETEKIKDFYKDGEDRVTFIKRFR
jgi:ribosomal protein S18 acetylase RimI-like enzyme